MIPNLFHFVFGMKPDFGGKPFNIIHYLAIKSAYEVNTPERMYLHYQFEPDGYWWELAKPFLHLNKVEAPEEIHGNKLMHVAHQSDIIRLKMLNEFGGIYLDLDTISIKPLKEFLDNSFVIAKEYLPPVYYTFGDRVKNCIRTANLKHLYQNQEIYGLCNAVMMSEPHSPFIELWLDSYKTFRSKGKDEFWVEHSVKIPYEISKHHPKLVTILEPEIFHFPSYDPKGLKWLFIKNTNYPKAYIHHLWETNAWEYISKIDEQSIKDRDTTYNVLARKYLKA